MIHKVTSLQIHESQLPQDIFCKEEPILIKVKEKKILESGLIFLMPWN